MPPNLSAFSGMLSVLLYGLKLTFISSTSDCGMWFRIEKRPVQNFSWESPPHEMIGEATQAGVAIGLTTATTSLLAEPRDFQRVRLLFDYIPVQNQLCDYLKRYMLAEKTPQPATLEAGDARLQTYVKYKGGHRQMPKNRRQPFSTVEAWAMTELPERVGLRKTDHMRDEALPPEAKWTKISRKLVSPEALVPFPREQFAVLDDCIIFYHAVTRAEIMGHVAATHVLRGMPVPLAIDLPEYGCSVKVKGGKRYTPPTTDKTTLNGTSNGEGLAIGLFLKFDQDCQGQGRSTSSSISSPLVA